MMDNNSAWEKFQESGSVMDYLKYKKSGVENLLPAFNKYNDSQGEKNEHRSKRNNHQRG